MLTTGTHRVTKFSAISNREIIIFFGTWVNYTPMEAMIHCKPAIDLLLS